MSALRSPSQFRQDILQAARDLFFSEGYNAVTMDMLAQSAQLSKRTVYKYFVSKEEVARQVLEGLRRFMTSHFNHLMAETADDFPVLCKTFAYQIGRALKHVPHRFYAELHQNSPSLYREHTDHRHILIRNEFNELVGLGIEQGMVDRHLNHAIILELLIVTSENFLAPKTTETIGLPVPEMVTDTLSIVFRGLLTPEARRRYDAFDPARNDAPK